MKHLVWISLVSLGLLAGCQHSQAEKQDSMEGMHHPAAVQEVTRAIAVIHPTAGNEVKGVVIFHQVAPDQVHVVAELSGLAPNSRHGFHIHEFGDCSAPDASSAGGHYNPEGHRHGGPDAENHHAGDLGNIEANAQGNARLEITLHDLSINGPTNPILGRSVIVHAKPDDLKSQPTGESGSRIGCGVIGIQSTKH